MKIGTLIRCLDHEHMLALIHALRGNGIHTKQTENVHELEVIRIDEAGDEKETVDICDER